LDLKEYNLIATTERLTTSQACSELWMHLRAAGDPEPAVDRSPIRGVITARTSMEPTEAIHRLREQLREAQDRFKTLYRVMPIQRLTDSVILDIAETAKELAHVIGEDESFRVTLEKRRSNLRSREIIEAVAEGIDRRVDLEGPDWVVLVEMMGRHTGVSVVRPDEVLNVQKERYALATGG
jgi:tRNA acetyltransferase TAN1